MSDVVVVQADYTNPVHAQAKQTVGDRKQHCIERQEQDLQREP